MSETEQLKQKVSDLEAKLARFEHHAREMHRVDTEYGCGFYGETDWISSYETIRELAGCQVRHW